ncbi:hypothetical protein [Vibrio mediterranei]|uniref:hypothetical protein n=1 Tax=Vibrio mediterranei TaxID=689 RepID=UPI004067D622
MPISYIQKKLQERRARVAIDTVNELKNSPEYVSIIEDVSIIENELTWIYDVELIRDVYNRFHKGSGYPFRFCHLLLLSYYISYKDDEKREGVVLEPEDWPAIIPASMLIKVIEKSM